MTNLELHIETSIHCRECGDICEFFLNGTQDDLVRSYVFGIRGMIAKASQFFVERGWREQNNKTWLCARCERLANKNRRAA